MQMPLNLPSDVCSGTGVIDLDTIPSIHIRVAMTVLILLRLLGHDIHRVDRLPQIAVNRRVCRVGTHFTHAKMHSVVD